MSKIEKSADCLEGAWERPYNVARDRVGSIHDDAMAKQLGFRGAFVSARTHLMVFSPLLLQAFGQRWFERGTISMEFQVGTLDQEPVRAVLGVGSAHVGDIQVEARLENADGDDVAIGSASVGAQGEPTWLATKELNRGDDDLPYSLLDGIRPHQPFPDTEVVLTPQQAERFIGATKAALPWYSGASPWGGPIASQGLMVGALGAPCSAYLAVHPVAGVAIDGAIELRNIHGPVLLNQMYRASGEVVARGRSPKTEYIWYESRLEDSHGTRVAEMRMQLRFVGPRQIQP